MRSIDNFASDQRVEQQDRGTMPMFGQTMQVLFAPISVICLLLVVLFGVAIVIILSLIPTYLQRNPGSSSIHQGATLLSVTYKTDLSNQTSFTITDLNTLNQQLEQAFHLQGIDLSILSYSLNPGATLSTTGRKKRDTNSIQCEDGSTFSGVSLNLQFSVSSTKRQYTNHQWEQFINKLQKNIRSIYKQFSVTIPFNDNQIKSVQLTFCSLQILSNNELSNTTDNKIRLYCQVVILGAGIGGSHSAYRLAPIYNNDLCIFERENYVGGRAYDIDYNGTTPEAYSTTPIAPMGSVRFLEVQPVVKQLADELNITYHRYDYQTNLIKARGKFYTSYNEMCSMSYTDLNCADDANGFNAQDQLWAKLLDEFHKSPLNLYSFADLTAFCRSVLGDEATDFLRDSFRFRGDFLNTDAYSYLEFLEQDFNVFGTIYYPQEGLSQFAKRMIYQATRLNNARSYLNEEVIKIDENINNDYIFSIETTNYKVYGKQLIAAILPTGWTNIQGSIANQIKSDKHFQSILPVKVVIIDSYWPRRWWEESSSFGPNIDRAWTKQNCISFIEILSQQPQKKEQNVTRTVYDDGLCVDTWSTLIHRSSQTDLIEEILRGLRSIFTDIEIPKPTKTFTQIWPVAWHFQRSNSNVTNKQIVSWALKPITRFEKHQISLVGEAFNIDRSTWIDGAIKSSLMSLNSQFNSNNTCFQKDAAVSGTFCSGDYINF